MTDKILHVVSVQWVTGFWVYLAGTLICIVLARNLIGLSWYKTFVSVLAFTLVSLVGSSLWLYYFGFEETYYTGNFFLFFEFLNLPALSGVIPGILIILFLGRKLRATNA